MKQTTSHKKLIWVSIILAVIALALGSWLQLNRERDPSIPVALENGTVFPARMALKDFKLINTKGETFTKQNLKGHWSLLFFGFTHCPMLCPTTLAELNKAYQVLQKKEAKNLVQIVFISIDPDRDTPKQIRDYLQHFNTNFMGATGDKDVLDQMTKQLGILYMKSSKSGDRDYTIEHSGAILIIDPRGAWVGMLSTPHKAASIVKDVMRIQKLYHYN